jgi:DNA-binding NarL/FixJ family response regulator
VSTVLYSAGNAVANQSDAMPEVSRSYRILLVEDDPAHARIAERAFESAGGAYLLDVAGSLQHARSAIAAAAPDLCIADFRLPDGRGTDLIGPRDGVARFPVVVMTSQGDETVAVEALKAGALDYVVKSATLLMELPHVARRALREWEHVLARRSAEQRLAEEERRHRAVLEAVPDLIFVVSRTGQFLDCRGGRREFAIDQPSSFVGQNLYDFVRRQTYDEVIEACSTVLRLGQVQTVVFELLMADRPRFVEARVAFYDADSVLLILRDVTDRQLVAHKLESLTSRELQVLQLVADGKSNKEVGRVLDISIKTVEAHRARVMKKLEARNMADLMRAALAVEDGA